MGFSSDRPRRSHHFSHGSCHQMETRSKGRIRKCLEEAIGMYLKQDRSTEIEGAAIMCKMESDLESRPHIGDVRDQPNGRKAIKRKCGSHHIKSPEVVTKKEADENRLAVRKQEESNNSTCDCEDNVRSGKSTIVEETTFASHTADSRTLQKFPETEVEWSDSELDKDLPSSANNSESSIHPYNDIGELKKDLERIAYLRKKISQMKNCMEMLGDRLSFNS